MIIGAPKIILKPMWVWTEFLIISSSSWIYSLLTHIYEHRRKIVSFGNTGRLSTSSQQNGRAEKPEIYGLRKYKFQFPWHPHCAILRASTWATFLGCQYLFLSPLSFYARSWVAEPAAYSCSLLVNMACTCVSYEEMGPKHSKRVQTAGHLGSHSARVNIFINGWEIGPK